MRDQNIGDVLVTEGDRLRGIVTDRDIVVRCVTEGGDISQTRLINACSAELAFAGPDMSVDEAAELMGKKAVRRLPVVDNGRAVGIVSIGDLAVERAPTSVLGQISADAPNN
jgi:CBS domain-containing protein